MQHAIISRNPYGGSEIRVFLVADGHFAVSGSFRSIEDARRAYPDAVVEQPARAYGVTRAGVVEHDAADFPFD